jgi:ribosomal protein L35AE/L33A
VTHLGAGWRLVHVTDRVIELRKDDAAYRRLIGRDGYVRVRAEPGMDRQALIEKAVEVAQRNDEALAERVAKQLMPRHVTRYHARQGQLAAAFGTPEDPEIGGIKRP